MNPPPVNPFTYPPAHVRRHAPGGYAEYGEYKPWLRDEFSFRCVYCLQREQWSRFRASVFGVDHVIPQSDPAGLALVCVYSNLVYACNQCNSYRQDIDLIDPCSQSLGEHVQFNPDGGVTPLTAFGEVIVEVLHLDSPTVVNERRRIANLIAEYATDPNHPVHVENFHLHFGFPDDLPDLAAKRPPEGNPLKQNLAKCYHSQREAGTLPRFY